MQAILINDRISKQNIISLEKYVSLPNKKEYVLYSDNILEGITLLNLLSQTPDLLTFYAVVYEPIDQPIYIFKDSAKVHYAIKVCGAYHKWQLPNAVCQLIDYVDLPDYVLYSIQSQKPILAGENTETASVGNSQWQREGRKLGAAKYRCPFIYQTFYSGKDESLDTIREPSSLQVYNQLIYSARYKIPSLVAYFENNFEGAQTRERQPKDSSALFVKYIKSVLLSDIHKKYIDTKREYEKQFYFHMISYLKEGKYSPRGTIDTVARLEHDFPVINARVKQGILVNTETFISALLSYLYNESSRFIQEYPIDDLNLSKFVPWTGYRNKPHIGNIIRYLTTQKSPAISYIPGNAKIALADTRLCKQFLCEKFPQYSEQISSVLNTSQYPKAILMPLRIHKKSNGNLTFAPDPESGEIVAFCELFGYNYQKQKTRPVIGYCIVDTPQNFDLDSKQGTKLYKALAKYIDVLILNDKDIITSFTDSLEETNYKPNSILNIHPISSTEEMGIVSTYLNQSTINAKWLLCFIHTHHSSWQQFMLHNPLGTLCQHKIDRVSTKLDLIMQDKSLFFLAEGKNNYAEILADRKIQQAMRDAGNLINKLYQAKHINFEAFIYNYALPSQEPDYYLSREKATVQGAIARGHFKNIANSPNFVVIMVYLLRTRNGMKTKFQLVYSATFPNNLRTRLNQEFEQ